MSNLPSNHHEFRRRLGAAYTVWMSQNNLTQQLIHDISSLLGLKVYNSSISQFQRGILDPRTLFIHGLGELNKWFSEGDYSIIKSRNTLDRIQEAEAFFYKDDNGRLQVATGADFFAMFTGDLEICDLYLPRDAMRALLTNEDLEEQQKEVQALFQELCIEECMSRKEAWSLIASKMSEDNVAFDDQTWFKMFLLDLHDVDMDEYRRVLNRYHDISPLLVAIEALLKKEIPDHLTDFDRKVLNQTN